MSSRALFAAHGAEVMERGLRSATSPVDECVPVADLDALAQVYEAILARLGGH